MTIYESDLPGIGRKFQIMARSGDKLVIVVHDDGRRELYHFYHNDPDESISMVALDDYEARQAAGIIGGLTYRPKALESLQLALDDLVIDWCKVELDFDCVNKTIGELRVRKTTGASILAIVEPDHSKKINPGPDQILRQGATLVIAGERAQVRALRHLIARGSQ